jgi:hypothetical protein
MRVELIDKYSEINTLKGFPLLSGLDHPTLRAPLQRRGNQEQLFHLTWQQKTRYFNVPGSYVFFP